MSEVEIRPLAASERDIWETLFQGYADFYKVAIDDNIKNAVWGWIFDEGNDFWCDVAVDGDGRVIGFTQYQLMHRSLGGSMVCYLSDLFVDPGVRGSGAGRKLIDHVFRLRPQKQHHQRALADPGFQLSREDAVRQLRQEVGFHPLQLPRGILIRGHRANNSGDG